MTKREHAMPEPNRSAAEIEFVLRHAKRKRGPELLRDLARTEENAPPNTIRRRAWPAEAGTEFRKRWL